MRLLNNLQNKFVQFIVSQGQAQVHAQAQAQGQQQQFQRLKVYRKQKLLGNLSSDNGNTSKMVTWKYNFILFVLLCDFFNSFNLYKNNKLPRNW